MFGNLTVHDLAYTGFRDVVDQTQPRIYKGEFEVKGYKVDSDMRFNFPNKGYRVPQVKMKRYLDELMEKKQMIPSPDKYNGQRPQFIDPKEKRHTIYPFNNRNFIQEAITISKKVPGVAAYDITQFDEKFVKPPKNTVVNLAAQKTSIIDEVIMDSKQVPFAYNQVKIVSKN